MDTLYSKSEETFANSIISIVTQDRLLIALARVSNMISSLNLPVSLRPHVLVRALRILRAIERERNLLDLGFVRYIPHPGCGEAQMALGELWELPREHEWLCGKCGRPLYDIQKDKN